MFRNTFKYANKKLQIFWKIVEGRVNLAECDSECEESSSAGEETDPFGEKEIPKNLKMVNLSETKQKTKLKIK